MLWIVCSNNIKIEYVQFDKHDKNETIINEKNIYRVTLGEKAKQSYLRDMDLEILIQLPILDKFLALPFKLNQKT
jgi:hypothetical protein